MLDWHDVIDRTALGFDQVKPPGLAEVTALDPTRGPDRRARRRAQPDAADRAALRQGAHHRRRRAVRPDLGAPPPSAHCSTANPSPPNRARPRTIALPAGQQELVISPGPAFVADGVQLTGPLAATMPSAPMTSTRTTQWQADHREVDVTASDARRVLVVPESINPGWTAHSADGAALTPITVNGWQQGWVRARGHVGHASPSTSRRTPPTGSACSADWPCSPCCCCSLSCPVRRTTVPRRSRPDVAAGPVGAGSRGARRRIRGLGNRRRRRRRRRDRAALPTARERTLVRSGWPSARRRAG